MTASYQNRLKRSWKFFASILIPLVLLPILFTSSDDVIRPGPGPESPETKADEAGEEMTYKKSSRLAYIILVMAIYWVLEIIPIPITSLFPLFLFPLFGIDDAANVSKSYMKESNTIFLGGAIVALAIEYCNLHRRVALKLITIFGVSPRRLMFGIMAVVSFLSMWISNTTCCTMIVPIIVAIVDEIHDVTDAANEIDAQIDNIPSTRFSFANVNNQPRNSSASVMRRGSSAFGNPGFSSNRNHDDDEDDEEEGQRSTLGVLEGRRPTTTGSTSPNNLRHENRRASAMSANRVHFQPPQIVERKATLTKPTHLQVNMIKGDLAAERRQSVSFDNNNDQLQLYVPNRRASIASITEPGRIESMINLPSPTSDFGEAEERRQKVETEKWRRIKNMYLFALAYAANIGGTATITGTGPNKVFKEVIKPYKYDISQDGRYLEMTFFTWLAFNLPPMLVNIVVAWVYLTIKYCGLPKFAKTAEEKAIDEEKRWKEKQVRLYLKNEYEKLGKMTFHEIGVAVVFVAVVILWIFRDPQVFKGWNEISSGAETGDSTAALLGACLLFIIPRSWTFLSSKDDARLETLLDWKYVTQKLPWGVLLLLGSGYAIGDSAERTGLTTWVGTELQDLDKLPDALVLLVVILFTALITEVASNTAVAAVLLPVLLGLSREMQVHPLYLTVASAVTASYAFMLPVASPVNAIVFAAGDFSIWEMITNGYILKAICVLVFYVNTVTLGEGMFEYSTFMYPPPSEPPVTEGLFVLTNSTVF